MGKTDIKYTRLKTGNTTVTVLGAEQINMHIDIGTTLTIVPMTRDQALQLSQALLDHYVAGDKEMQAIAPPVKPEPPLEQKTS